MWKDLLTLRRIPAEILQVAIWEAVPEGCMLSDLRNTESLLSSHS